MSFPVNGLDSFEQAELDQLVGVWRKHEPRNTLRSTYFDTKNVMKDLGISLPPSLRRAEAMLSWPSKAVYSLTSRCQFDGFVMPGEEQDPFGIGDVLADNLFDVELPQALVSSAVHAVCFVSVTAGDVSAGEPEVLVLARSARFGAAVWDRRRRAVRSALAIADVDEAGSPSELVMYLPDRVVTCVKGVARWSVDRQENSAGRVLVTPLVYRPELDRPFGHSRISRAVMQLTDAAIRTVVRGEVGAEFFATPQRYILGADPDAFDSGDSARWSALVSRMLGIGKDEDGDVPEVGQFPQISMQPHNDQLRMFAGLFAAETGLSLNSLGIVQENPSSAEAIYAAKEDLVMECNAANRVWGAALRQIAENIVLVRDGEVPADLRQLRAKWQNPATPSVVSAADAAVKQASVIPWLAESEVLLEFLGYDEATRTRLLSDKRRAEAKGFASGLGLAAQRLSEVAPLSDPVVSDTPVEVELYGD